jgi:hypothetical protein
MNVYKRRFLTADERFDSFHDKAVEGCHEWTGGISANGYGMFWIDGRAVSAHRYAWTRVHGPTDGLHVLHHCDNKRCVNVSHLFSGTNADNVADKMAKGRRGSTLPHNPSRGTAHPRAKLTDEEVRSIRTETIGYGDSKRLCSKYGITATTLWHIRRGTTWKHLL